MAAVRIVCDCGTTKTLINDLRVCVHCDSGFTAPNCDICAKYATIVGRRISA